MFCILLILLYSPVASIRIHLFSVYSDASSISFATVQLFPPPVVPKTAQWRPKRELREILHKALFDVNFPKGAKGTSFSSFFTPKAEIYAPICSSEHEKAFEPTEG